MAIVVLEKSTFTNHNGQQFELRWMFNDVTNRLTAVEWDKNAVNQVFFELRDAANTVIISGNGAGNSGQQPIPGNHLVVSDGQGWFQLQAGWTYKFMVIS